MIIINGKVFRNLEEQVAYLSEMIPLFEEDNGQLIIKQGDGTEIARITLDAVSNMNVSTANDITTITITNADSTTQTFTIDMSVYLKKVSTQTQVMQAYIKQTDGSQQMVFVHWDNIRDTIPIRDQTGNIRVASVPTTGTHATSKNYVDSAIAKYIHFIELTFLDGCSEQLKGFVILENKSNTQFTMSTFKDLFTKKISVNGGNSTWNVIPIVASQYFEKTGNDRPVPCWYYYDDQNDIFDNNTYTDGGYSSGLTLQSLTDSVSTL